ncbi:MAG: MaoC family dehydratase [Planctomycetales bacterium]
MSQTPASQPARSGQLPVRSDTLNRGSQPHHGKTPHARTPKTLPRRSPDRPTLQSGTHRMELDQICAFAEQFDPQPFHLDPEAAKTTLFGEQVASGWHTAAVTMPSSSTVAYPSQADSSGRGELRWPRPTRPGDLLHVESEILDIKTSRSRPDRGIVTIRSETKNQHGETVQILTSKLVALRSSPKNTP